MNIENALKLLLQLSPGRHYAASLDKACWTMVGRNLTTVDTWTIVPPASSLTYVWDEGGSFLEFDGGSFEMRQGDWMWIDSGFGHKGHNDAGSNFLTVFFADSYIESSGLKLGSIGAKKEVAPRDLSNLLTILAASLLLGSSEKLLEKPLVSTLIDSLSSRFWTEDIGLSSDCQMSKAKDLVLMEHPEHLSLLEVAEELNVSSTELSRRFRKRFKISPSTYRKQLKLARATKLLVEGLSVTQAAAEAGFSDAAHFSRVFKDQYGVNPRQWRDALNIE